MESLSCIDTESENIVKPSKPPIVFMGRMEISDFWLHVGLICFLLLPEPLIRVL